MAELDWNKIVSDIGAPLLRYFSASFPMAIASDLVQETFIRLVRKYRKGEFDPKKGSVRMYAFGIAHYVRIEAFKATTVEDYYANVSEYELKVRDLSDGKNERGADLRRAIAELNENERQIILLHIDEELTLVEISEILKIPVGTIKSHVHRAKEKLKAKLLRKERELNG